MWVTANNFLAEGLGAVLDKQKTARYAMHNLA